MNPISDAATLDTRTDYERGYAQATADLHYGILGFPYPAVSALWRCGYIARLMQRPDAAVTP